MKKCTRLKFARWAVKERYFGVFDQTHILCTCTSLYEAANIIDNLVKNYKGRTIEFFAEKIDEEDWDIMDEETYISPITLENVNLKKYKEGISCLINH